MQQNDLVSVVIPVYNSEKYLAECIESVLGQTYKEIEILAVNDGSTDNSLEILKKYSDRIEIIDQKNQGLASALNAGIGAMKGKWLKWFSPDDVMYQNTVEALIKTATSLSENTIIYSNWDIIDKSGKKLRSFSESNYNNLEQFDFNVRLLEGQQINVNTALIPKILLSNIKMKGNINPVLVDYDFFLRAGLLEKAKFHLVEEPLIKFRVHESQLSHKNIIKSLEELESTRKEILSRLDKNKKDQYVKALEKYNKQKSISKKSLKLGLKIISSIFSSSVTDKILVFYLNKIRRTR